jgi:hypothetical protein
MEFIMKTKKTGRPRKFKSPDEMAPLIDKYFKEADDRKQPYTVPGLALALGFSYRQGPWEYAKKYSKFTDTIKKARLRIEEQRNVQLISERNAAGKIFDLCNNFGWEQPHKIEHFHDPGPDSIIIRYQNKSKNQVEKAEGNLSEILNDVQGVTRGLPNRSQRKIRE